METEQMYNHNITPAPLLHTIYSPSAKHQTPLRLLTWVYTSHYLLYPRQNLKMIIIYNYYMLQPDTSLSRFANQPNRVWLTWARHLAGSHLQVSVSAVNIKANFAIQLNQTSIIHQPEAHRSSYRRTGRHLCTFPVIESKPQWASIIFRISELH
jgi:hypothetical protein